jgi:glycosyl-4,4'-diaponeurosporenoate acyltransferase
MERTAGELMWLELPNIYIVVINVIGIPAAHLLIAWWSTRLPSPWFQCSIPNSAEKPHRVYEDIFLIRRWKKYLPDAAPWLKGFPKGQLKSSDPDYLRAFILETRRGEFSHWIQLVVISAFILWNPYPANYIIVTYALLSNMPCILNLRYTRKRMLYVLLKKTSHPS